MLVLKRKQGQDTRVGDLVVRVLDVRGKNVKLGFIGNGKVVRMELVQPTGKPPQAA